MVGKKQLFMETSSLCPVSINHLVSSFSARVPKSSACRVHDGHPTTTPWWRSRFATLPESWDVTAKGETWAFHVPSGYD